MDCATPTAAASWNTTSIPSNALSIAIGSQTLPCWNSTSRLRYVGTLPESPCTCGSRLSSTRTECPVFSNRSARCEPIKPAPPVINTRVMCLSYQAGRAGQSLAQGDLENLRIHKNLEQVGVHLSGLHF